MVKQTISHYCIQEHICNGGMGEIYRAEDKDLKRQVALKFLHQSLVKDEETKQRFLMEAQAVATLDHNNICTIYEVGETKDERLYIAMAYYQGHTLKERIRKNNLKLDEIIDITSQIASGLARAHKSKIIHRDIKPDNIIITENNEVKILDFGLAKLLDPNEKFRDNSISGTLAYMSPEQLYRGNIDNRSDIWSLGVVLFEMLTGRLPFKGKYDQIIAYNILNEEPELSAVFKSDIPTSLKWVLEKTLAKEPELRYQHADEIPVDLKIIQTKRHSIAEIMINSKDFKKRIKRLKSIIFSLSLMLISILVVLISMILE